MTGKKPEAGSTYHDWYVYGAGLLTASGVEDAANDARLLLEYAAQIDHSYYYLHMHEPMQAEASEVYADLLLHRAEREPLQYLTGEAPFCGLLFHVTPAVLIPRQDTEILVEEAAKRLRPGMRLLDLCTGSGCVLLSLMNRIEVNGTGSDLSAEALAVAEENAGRLHTAASWIQSDLFSRIPGRFDMIVSNPPYIASDVIDGMQEEVARHEPRLALDGGADGLDLLERIIQEAPAHLHGGGWLLTEIGFDQGDAVREYMLACGYEETEVIKDLEQRDRVVAGRRPDTCTSHSKN